MRVTMMINVSYTDEFVSLLHAQLIFDNVHTI